VVIDKDLASAVLARDIHAQCLMMLTGVEHVFLNFKQPNEQALSRFTVKDARKYLQEGHFPPGSMGPKVQAAINFLEWGGERAIVTSIDKVKEALNGQAGSIICKD
jgi:carbamate kinase (EC 2.7.2.2)